MAYNLFQDLSKLSPKKTEEIKKVAANINCANLLKELIKTLADLQDSTGDLPGLQQELQDSISNFSYPYISGSDCLTQNMASF